MLLKRAFFIGCYDVSFEVCFEDVRS